MEVELVGSLFGDIVARRMVHGTLPRSKPSRCERDFSADCASLPTCESLSHVSRGEVLATIALDVGLCCGVLRIINLVFFADRFLPISLCCLVRARHDLTPTKNEFVYYGSCSDA